MSIQRVDHLFIGGGIMSTTLASLLHTLDPSRSMMLVEQLDSLAAESSDAFNNAGTGHAGYCELNYTPQQSDGSVSIDRAVKVNLEFGHSLEYWSALVRRKQLPDPSHFINRVPHLSWVQGADAVNFLRERYNKLSAHPLFDSMEWTENPLKLAAWMPLMFNGRRANEPMAATRVSEGADVDFGALTRLLGNRLQDAGALDIRLNHKVVNLTRSGEDWVVSLRDLLTDRLVQLRARFVFVGAGGAALPLLQKAHIPEIRGYAGFPVSGLWLRCDDTQLANRHGAKVYGMAPVGAPPMSVPHLDKRIVNGKASLLFGPFAGFTTRLLKAGAPSDLLRTLNTGNVRSLMDVGLSQWSLTKYLLTEMFADREDRLKALNQFLPELDGTQWDLVRAGQRVQVIKPNLKGRGVLQFGTEVVTTSDGSLAALLGASPGASVSVSAMLNVVERCFPELCMGAQAHRLQEQIPSWRLPLEKTITVQYANRDRTLQTLGLSPQPSYPWSDLGAA